MISQNQNYTCIWIIKFNESLIFTICPVKTTQTLVFCLVTELLLIVKFCALVYSLPCLYSKPEWNLKMSFLSTHFSYLQSNNPVSIFSGYFITTVTSAIRNFTSSYFFKHTYTFCLRSDSKNIALKVKIHKKITTFTIMHITIYIFSKFFIL